ncbi:class F sortase [Spirillospora sp. CA-142024]|uniref:class F sortase n=1 Tax=Spirillospora sp. CA-142024 TaxID=3240036 RepID=UPI003D930A58
MTGPDSGTRGGRRLPAVAAAVLLLAGLALIVQALRGHPGPPGPPAWAASPRPAGHPGPVLGRSEPTRIALPSIGVRAPVTPLSPTSDGSAGTPPIDRPEISGWHAPGPSPGEQGPAVILGHVDDRNGPAVFYDLGRLRPGDTVEVTRRDGRTAVFTVEAVEKVAKSRFPSQKVYGPTRHATLRLVTCGGTFDKATHSYRDNIITYASETSAH